MRRSNSNLLNLVGAQGSRIKQSKISKGKGKEVQVSEESTNQVTDQASSSSSNELSAPLSFLYPPSCFSFPISDSSYRSSRNYSTHSEIQPHSRDPQDRNNLYPPLPISHSSSAPKACSSSTSKSSALHLHFHPNPTLKTSNESSAFRSVNAEEDRDKGEERLRNLIREKGPIEDVELFQAVHRHLEKEVKLKTGLSMNLKELDRERSTNWATFSSSSPFTSLNQCPSDRLLHSLPINFSSSNLHNDSGSVTISTSGFQTIFLPFIKAYYSQNLAYQAGKLLIFLLIGLEQLSRISGNKAIEAGISAPGLRESESGNGKNDQHGKGPGKQKSKMKGCQEANIKDLITKETEDLIPTILRSLIEDSSPSKLHEIKIIPSSSNPESLPRPQFPASSLGSFDPALAESILRSSFSLNWNWSTTTTSIETSRILISVIKNCFNNLQLLDGIKLLREVIAGTWKAEERRDNLRRSVGERMESSNELKNLSQTIKYLKNSVSALEKGLKFNLRQYEGYLKLHGSGQGDGKRERGPKSGMLPEASQQQLQASSFSAEETQLSIRLPIGSQGHNGNRKLISASSLKWSNEERTRTHIVEDYSETMLILSELLEENYLPLAVKDEQVAFGSEEDDSVSAVKSSSTPTSSTSASPTSKGSDVSWILKRFSGFDELLKVKRVKAKVIKQNDDFDLTSIASGIKRNLINWSDKLPVGGSQAALENLISSSSKSRSSSSLQSNSTFSSEFRRLNSLHLAQFSYNTLTNYYLTNPSIRSNSLGLKTLGHMNELQIQGLKVDGITDNIVRRSNRLGRVRSSRNEPGARLGKGKWFGARNNTDEMTSKSQLVKILDEAIDRKDSHMINEILLDWLITTESGRKRWFSSDSNPKKGGDVISVKHLIYHLHPGLDVRRERRNLLSTSNEASTQGLDSKRGREESRKSLVLNPKVLTTCLDLAVKSGKVGLAMEIWSLIKKESFNSLALQTSNPIDTKSNKNRTKPWHIPLESATLFIQLCEEQAKRGLKFKSFLPLYQTPTTNFKFFPTFLEDKEQELDSLHNGKFRYRKNVEIRNRMRTKTGKKRLELRGNERFRRGAGESRRVKIYLPGRNPRSRLGLGRNRKVPTEVRLGKGSLRHLNKGSGWKRVLGPQVRRRDAARASARWHYFSLMFRWGYYRLPLQPDENKSIESNASLKSSTSFEPKLSNFPQFPDLESDFKKSTLTLTPGTSPSPPVLDARFFNSLLNTFGKFDGMLEKHVDVEADRNTCRRLAVSKLRNELKVWESKEARHRIEEEEYHLELRRQELSRNGIGMGMDLQPPSILNEPTTQIFLTSNNSHQLLSKAKPLDPTLPIILRDFYKLGFRIPLGYLQFLPFALGLEGKEAREVIEEMLREEESFGETGKCKGGARFDLYRLEEGKRKDRGL